jgi:hypothetical protein
MKALEYALHFIQYRRQFPSFTLTEPWPEKTPSRVLLRWWASCISAPSLLLIVCPNATPRRRQNRKQTTKQKADDILLSRRSVFSPAIAPRYSQCFLMASKQTELDGCGRVGAYYWGVSEWVGEFGMEMGSELLIPLQCLSPLLPTLFESWAEMEDAGDYWGMSEWMGEFGLGWGYGDGERSRILCKWLNSLHHTPQIVGESKPWATSQLQLFTYTNNTA